jgi:hypothetical protein
MRIEKRLPTWREINLQGQLLLAQAQSDREFMDRLLELRIKKLEREIERTN